jgi:hypothetical protein
MIAVALGHQAVYQLRFGHGAGLDGALAGHGHSTTVPLLALAAALSAASFIAIVVWRARRLGRLLRHETSGSEDGTVRGLDFLGIWMGTATRVAAAAVGAYVLLENAEHLLTHGHVEGLAVLGSGDPSPGLLTLCVVAALVSLVSLIVRWREVVLEEQLRGKTRPRLHRQVIGSEAPRWDAEAAIGIYRWVIARRTSGRAPPVLSVC